MKIAVDWHGDVHSGVMISMLDMSDLKVGNFNFAPSSPRRINWYWRHTAGGGGILQWTSIAFRGE